MDDRSNSRFSKSRFRFFSPEQVDQILREGARHGRTGSHAAIERILKHEPRLERSELWSRIRQLKYSSHKATVRRAVWSPDDDQSLRKGYESGASGKREVIRDLLKRHPEWRPSVVWRRAARLGLVRKRIKRGEERRRHRWSENDDRILLNLAGDRKLRAIAKILHRSEHAVGCRLAVLGKNTRVQLDGYSRRTLAEELHMGRSTIQRLIVEGLLEVQDPRITPKSLAMLKKSGRLMSTQLDDTDQSGTQTQRPREAGEAENSNNSSLDFGGKTAVPTRSSRAKQLWAEVAETLGVGLKEVEKLILRASLKLYDPRITEVSFRKFCRRYGALVNYDSLNRDTREWLRTSMDLNTRTGEDIAKRFLPLRRHALVVRRCTKCKREIRGNAFFRHDKKCPKDRSQAPAAVSTIENSMMRRAEGNESGRFR